MGSKEARPPRYSRGQLVYHAANSDATGVVVGICDFGGYYTYVVSWGGDQTKSECHEVELTDERSYRSE